MEIDQVQLLFEGGKLSEAIMEPSPTGNGWLLEFRAQDGELIKLTTHGGEERLFRSLDAATNTARRIGFPSARVEEAF